MTLSLIVSHEDNATKRALMSKHFRNQIQKTWPFLDIGAVQFVKLLKA